jgi:lipopolysaccharide export system protein LptA
MKLLHAAVAALILLPLTATAQPGRERNSAFGTLGSNKEPIKIDADRLDVYDRDGRAVFEGNVVAVQGDTTMKCTALTVLYEARSRGAAQAGTPGPAVTPAASQGVPGAPTDSAIKKIDCKGPVTIVSKTQTATGDNATFDRVANRVLLNGNVTLADGPNLTRGERLVYDLNTGVANVDTTPGGRVRAMFTPGGGSDAATPAPAAAPAPAPAPKPAPKASPAAAPAAPRQAQPAPPARQPPPVPARPAPVAAPAAR